MIRFERHSTRPLIPRVPGTWKSVYTANAEVLRLGEDVLLYYRGQGDEHHDQIGVASVPFSEFTGANFEEYPSNPVIKAGPAGYDWYHALDPGAVVFNGAVYVYYTAHGRDPAGAGISGTGVAVSDDGYCFAKPLGHAVIAGGYAPDAVVRDGKVWLIYARDNGQGQFEFYANCSEDPLFFDPSNETKIMSPSAQRAWESKSIITPRVFDDDGTYYMTYVGSGEHQDYGGAVGLARSTDLLFWERYPMNPVFHRADGATWDNGALWFCTLFHKDTTWYLYYEGGGGPDLVDRDANYAGYGNTACSQIGLATYAGTWW